MTKHTKGYALNYIPLEIIVMDRCSILAVGFRCHRVREYGHVRIASKGTMLVRPYSTSPPFPTPPSQPPSSGTRAVKGKDIVKKKKWIRPSTVLTFLALGTFVGYEIDTHLNASVLQRNIRTAIAGTQIALDYKFNFDPSDAKSVEALHERCANRLLRVCEANGGLYVKLGQAIGVQAAILPKPYHALSKMFDDAERMSFVEVKQVVERELGKKLTEVFDTFDQVPIAAASVAQVHRAVLKSTKEVVAVKVQRPSIQSQAFWDLLSFRILLRFYSRVFDLPLAYFGRYISDQIHKETDFKSELRNATLARKYISEDPEKLIRETAYVPACYDEFCTSKIIVMEYVKDAVRMTDEQGIKKMGLSIREVARTVCEAFASQIFQHGFVQCDGHAGNVLVRRHPNGKRGQHQVVLIDHGLYVTLTETFRRQYAELWRAIFQLDISTLERITTEWGMGQGSAELFASATLMRPWKKPKSKEELEKEAEEKAKDSQHHINKQKEMIKGFLVHVEMVPKELIFVGRSMRIVQANNQVLHSPVNRINILARHAASALLTNDTPTLYRVLRPRQSSTTLDFSNRFSLWLRTRLSFLTFRSTLFLLDIAFVGSSVLRVCHRSWLIVKNSVTHGPWSPEAKLIWKSKAGGFEDDLESGMRQLAKDEFGVELDENAFMG